MVDCHLWSNQLEAGCGQKIHGFLLCFHHPHCQIQQPVKMATKGISDILLCNESDEVSPEKVEQRGKFKVGGNREKCDVLLPWQQSFWITTIGSLSNNNGDSNENVKKKIDHSDMQNNHYARDHAFFVHFLAVVARLRHKTS